MSTNPQSPASQGTIRSLFRDRSFLNIWTVGLLTNIVRWLQILVLGIYTFKISGSPFLVSMVPMLFTLPLAFCGPFVGVLADRIDRRVILGVALIVMLVVAVFFWVAAHTGDLTFLHVAVFAVLSGLFWAVDIPVRRRLMGDLAGESLAAAMGLDSATSNATRMSGPILGGVMLEFFSLAGVFALSAVVFVISAILIMFVRLPDRVDTTTASIFVRELIAGVRFVLGSARLRRVFSITIVFNIWGFPFISMIPVIGTGQLGLNPVMVGLLSGTEGLGAFVGAICVAFLARPSNFYPGFVWGTTLYMAMVGYLGLLSFVAGGPTHSFVAVSGALWVIGMASAWFAAMQGTLSYLEAGPEYRSRVLGVLTVCIGTSPLGFMNIGWMAETFGVSVALIVTSMEGLFAMLLLWVYEVGHDSEPKAVPTA